MNNIIVLQMENGMTMEIVCNSIEGNAMLKRMQKDAERYRFVRSQHWSDTKICFVVNPKQSVKLGAFCPSGDLLDAEIDAAMNNTKK